MISINYMHSHGVVHRDLKLENFLLTDKSDMSFLKLIDFGMSKFFDPSNIKVEMTTLIGTVKFNNKPYYVSPEVLNKKYD